MYLKFIIFIITGIILTFSAILLNKYYNSKKIVKKIQEVIYDEYNINLNENYCVQKKVNNSQTIGQILNSNGVSYADVDKIEQLSKSFFDLKSVKAGNAYHLYFTNDSLNKLHYFIYKISEYAYFQVNFKDTLEADLIKRKVVIKTAKTSCIIKSSLWQTMKNNKLDPNLAIKLSEIFAWVVDFYRIQKGDRFKVFYEKEFVNNKVIGIGNIKAAYFENAGKKFYAFHFDNDTVNDYFNENAESLRKAFLKAPLKFSRITSGYTNKRFHPVLKTSRAHLGTDYAAPTGTPIMSVGDGTVIEARYQGGNGNYVKIMHNSVYTTQYLHMSRFAKGIRPGVHVSQGDIIGYVGSTGLSTGPHVCFRFWKNGMQVNHLKEEFPNTAPLDSAYHKDFFKFVDFYRQGFDRMEFKEN